MDCVVLSSVEDVESVKDHAFVFSPDGVLHFSKTKEEWDSFPLNPWSLSSFIHPEAILYVADNDCGYAFSSIRRQLSMDDNAYPQHTELLPDG